ncbi:MAG: hypothetical protein LKI94_08705 [Sporolactobacillus sp.]|jgi:hypothetical protein|nr:hypothetical protein [Sporolactobacillus sp.]
MSFVSIIASPRQVSVVSDCCPVDLTETGNRVALTGNKPSATMLSECQILVCTGSCSAFKKMRKYFPYRSEPYTIGEKLLRGLEEPVQQVSYARQDVFAALVDTRGTVSCRLFSNRPGDRWKTLIPTEERWATLFLAGREVDEHAIGHIFHEFSRLLGLYGRNDFKQIKRAQRELNHWVAANDPLIGRRTIQLEAMRNPIGQ